MNQSFKKKVLSVQILSSISVHITAANPLELEQICDEQWECLTVFQYMQLILAFIYEDIYKGHHLWLRTRNTHSLT